MKYWLISIIAVLVLLSGVIVTSVTQSTTATVTVNEFLSVSLTNVPVQFSSMDPGETKNASVGNGFPLTATIGSESNVNANVSTKADAANFTSGSNTFNVGNMTWNNVTTGPWTAYLTSEADVCSSVSASGTCDIYHQLTIPSAQAAGSYSVDITITAYKAY